MIPMPAMIEQAQPLQGGIALQQLFAAASFVVRAPVAETALTSATSNSQALATGSDFARDMCAMTIEQLGKLPPNWDGHGGHAPTAVAIADARRFLARLPSHVRAPEVEPSGDGEVNLVWRSGDRYVEVGSNGDGSLSYFGKRHDLSDEAGYGDFGAGGAIPADLLERLSWFPNAAVRL